MVAAGWVDRATVPAAQVRASASAVVGAWVALAGPAIVEPGLVALGDRVWAVAAVQAYGNLVVRPAVAGREAPAAVEAAEALVVGLDRVAGLEPAVEAGALAVGQEPEAGLAPAVEAAQVRVAAEAVQVEVAA